VTTDLVIRDEGQYLATVGEIRALAERIDSIGDAKSLADKARAAQVWAERARLGDDQVNLAAVAKLWAERRAGELLIETRENGSRSTGAGTHESRGAQLSDLGITKHESSRFQQLAEIPADTFEQAVEQASENGKVTAAAIQRLAVPLSDELITEQQRQANVRNLNTCLRGFEVSPAHARAEIKRLIAGEHPFTPDRFEKAANAASAYAAALRKEGIDG
jgi:hypothetical protein